MKPWGWIRGVGAHLVQPLGARAALHPPAAPSHWLRVTRGFALITARCVWGARLQSGPP